MASVAINQLNVAPLGAGDLIDRTIRLYRRHFLALIRASVPPVVVSVAGAVLMSLGWRAFVVAGSNERLALYVALLALGGALMFAGYVLNLIVMGGASHTLVRHLLWNEAVTTRAVYRSVRARFWGLLGASLLLTVWVAVAFVAAMFVWYMVVLVAMFGVIIGGVMGASSGAAVWIAAVVGLTGMLVGGLFALWLFFFLVGRVAYVPQVLLVEGRGVFDAIGRSAELARGNVRRLMAMFLFTTFATYSVLMLLLIPLGWYGYLQGVNPLTLDETQWPMWYAVSYQVLTQSSTILLTPVWMLGLSHLYVDERVQKEGYDVELLAARTFGRVPELPGGRVAPLAPAIASQERGGTTAPELSRPPSAFKGSVLGL